MSAFAGKYCWTNKPVDSGFPPEVAAMLEARGPDGSHTMRMDSVSITCSAFHTTPESRTEVQPFVSSTGVAVAWDGRLDNREELQRILQLPGRPGDVELVSAAYQRWGHLFLEHIVGDYALCVWDSGTRTLLLARDPFATRPLYYANAQEYVFWSSEIGVVAALLGLDSLEIDDAYVAGYMTSTEEFERTPYHNIWSLRPGTAVIFRGQHRSTTRFWTLDPKREIYYSNDAQYEEHFTHLFRESIRRRLRSCGPVAAELSGGLDSSSIVCMADRILGDGSCAATGLETISHIYDESSSSDETAFINIVENHRGQPGHHIAESRYSLFHPTNEEEDIYLPTPLHCFAETWRGMSEVMDAAGARVLLCGQGGDHVFMNETVYLPLLGDLILQGRLGEVGRYLRAWGEAARTNYLKLLWKGAVWPLLPLGFRSRMSPEQLQIPSWMGRSFANQWRCRERLVARPEARVFRRPSAERQYTLIYDAVSLISPSYYRERACIEVSYPFLDQQVVEFLMAVPMDQKIRPGEARSLQRRTMRTFLPREISERKGKRGPDEAVYRGMIRHRSWIDHLVENSRLAQRGYVDGPAFVEAVKLACHGADVQIQPLVRALTLEIWLRSHERWSRRARAALEFTPVCRR